MIGFDLLDCTITFPLLFAGFLIGKKVVVLWTCEELFLVFISSTVVVFPDWAESKVVYSLSLKVVDLLAWPVKLIIVMETT